MTHDDDHAAEGEAPDPVDFGSVSVDMVVRDGKKYLRDPVRRQLVRLTPEEWVRQHVLAYLIGVVGVPPGLIAVEKAFEFNGMTRRADVIVHDRSAMPLILVECKAPGIPLDQAVFDQVGRYNVVVGARYVLVSNGERHSCYRRADTSENLTFIPALPRFEELILP